MSAIALRHITIDRDFAAWRNAARDLLREAVSPDAVLWSESRELALPLFGSPASAPPPPGPATMRISPSLMETLRYVACHRDPARWGLMYRILWRIAHGEPELMQVVTDDDVHRLLAMQKSVRRDRHKMTAFVRFRAVPGEDGQQMIAWHRPDHYIVKLTAPFFRDRFSTLRWTILTPDDSVSWNGQELIYGPGVPAREAPAPDDLESLWRTYYANIFNPARIKLRAMKKEMPVRHWATLPEAELIPELLRQAPQRVEAMVKKSCKPQGTSAAEYLPPRISLPQLRKAAESCRGCDLYCNATQVVFGEGSADSPLMFVGEQPGDQEDRAGKPFVGPAGQLLDELLIEAGIDRSLAYVTNAVKHFKFEPRGTRRIHAKPNAREMRACRPWLEAEIGLIKPRIIVALGATAAQSLMGAGFRITQHRGDFFADTGWAPLFMATLHPSALLRMPDEAAKRQGRLDVVSDLKKVAAKLGKINR